MRNQNKGIRSGLGAKVLGLLLVIGTALSLSGCASVSELADGEASKLSNAGKHNEAIQFIQTSIATYCQKNSAEDCKEHKKRLLILQAKIYTEKLANWAEAEKTYLQLIPIIDFSHGRAYIDSNLAVAQLNQDKVADALTNAKHGYYLEPVQGQDGESIYIKILKRINSQESRAEIARITRFNELIRQFNINIFDVNPDRGREFLQTLDSELGNHGYRESVLAGIESHIRWVQHVEELDRSRAASVNLVNQLNQLNQLATDIQQQQQANAQQQATYAQQQAEANQRAAQQQAQQNQSPVGGRMTNCITYELLHRSHTNDAWYLVNNCNHKVNVAWCSVGGTRAEGRSCEAQKFTVYPLYGTSQIPNRDERLVTYADEPKRILWVYCFDKTLGSGPLDVRFTGSGLTHRCAD